MGRSHQGGWGKHYARTGTHTMAGAEAGIGFVVSPKLHDQAGAAARHVEDGPAVTSGRHLTHGTRCGDHRSVGRLSKARRPGPNISVLNSP